MNRRSGVTLLELLVAVTISASCVSLAIGAASRVVESRTTANDLSRETLRAALARDLLIDMLSGMLVNDADARIHSIGQTVAGVSDDRLEFVTRSTPFRNASSARISLYIDRNPATEEGGLIAIVASRGERVRRIELDSRVAALSIDYLSQTAAGDVSEWSDNWDRATSLPRAVRISLDAIPTDTLPRVLRLPMIVVLAGPNE